MVVDNKMIGHRIKQRREHLKISQERLGEMIGVTYQQIQKYEKGTNKVSAERLSSIAENMKVPTSFFFENAEEFLVAEEREDENYSIREKKALSLQEQELLDCFRLLPDKDAMTNLVGFLRSLCKKKNLL
ncbi:MAG: helix-turn-helix transcriptional regulator [Thermodesulfovibrionia bacterium]|nr:helix-turn-helix transcriptional regulator [Thermodesulfovibrionia bacterium]